MSMENTTNDGALQYGAPPRPMNGAVATEQNRSIAEVQAAVIMAKQFPRDTVGAIQRIKMACQRPTLAEVAMYTYSRGGTEVTGPSIRMAEAIAQQWGNIQFGVRELSQANGESTMEAYAWDLESNARQSKMFQVPHERHTRNGVKRLTDPRDVYEMVANNGARRLRACILGIIPGDVVDIAVHEAEQTLRTSVQLTPERIKAMLELFEGLGVTRAMIEERIQRPIDALTPAVFVSLGKIANSLKDGISKVADWFRTTEVSPVQKSTRWSVNQMRDAQYEIEQMGKSTASEVLAQNPNLPEDQKLLIASWEFKGQEA